MAAVALAFLQSHWAGVAKLGGFFEFFFIGDTGTHRTGSAICKLGHYKSYLMYATKC